MIIYIDILFFENFILNFIILYAEEIISKSKIRFFQIMLASILGAVYSVMYYLIQNKIFSNFIIKIILSVVMLYVASLPNSFRELIKKIVLFYLTSFVFGGAALGAIYIVNSNNITIQNGVLIGNYTIKTIFIGVCVAFIILIIGFKLVKTKFSKSDLLCNIKIKINHKVVNTKAMLDTGNLLKEPITNIPVVVVEHTILYEVVPKEILDNTENILGGDFKDIPENIKNEYVSKLKIIPFSSLGKQNGMLLGLKSDGIEVEEESKNKNIEKVIIGIYTKKLSKKNEYRALLGIDTI